MIHRKRLFAFSLVGLFLLCLPVFIGGQARALNELCTSDGTIYSGVVSLPTDNYDIYVKLGGVGQRANVTAQASDSSRGCATIGHVEATDNSWQKVGAVAVDKKASEVQFNLVSDQTDTSYEFDRPMVMLVSQTTPACTPTTDCFVEIDGWQATLQSSQTDSDTGTLRIFYAKDIKNQTITEVRYYADNTLMYKTQQLEPFDQRSIPFNTHVAIRVVEFSNGQTATIEEAVPDSHPDSLGAMLIRTAKRYQTILTWAAVLAVTILLFHITRHIVRAYENRHYWLYAHGFIKDEPTGPLTPSRLSHIYTIDRVRKVIGGLSVVALIAVISIVLIILFDSYVIRLATVNGISMERSYQNGQRVFIDKTGVTFGQLNQTEFTPARGQVIAAYSLSRFATQADANDQNIIMKRVIGLPGERIVINGSVVTIYNAEHPEGFNPSAGAEWAKSVVDDPTGKQLDIKLGTDELFVMGDNRPNSIDSRENGPLLLRNVIGVVR